MVVAVAAVIMVQMPLNQVIEVVTVRSALVPAIGAVSVLRLVSSTAVLRRTGIRVGRIDRKRVLIHMVAMNAMQMPIVKIIGVSIMHDALMSAAGVVLVRMAFV